MGQVGVAEIAVEQVEQGLQPLDAQGGVAGRRRAEVVVDPRAAGSVTPAGGAYSLPRVGVPWSPKLVKVNGARPRGAVRKVLNPGSAPSCKAPYR